MSMEAVIARPNPDPIEAVKKVQKYPSAPAGWAGLDSLILT